MRNAPKPGREERDHERAVRVEPDEAADRAGARRGVTIVWRFVKNTTSNGTIIVDEEHDEDRAPERELEEGERVAGADRRDELTGDDEERDDDAVEQVRRRRGPASTPASSRSSIGLVGNERRRARRDLVGGQQRVDDVM